MAATRSFTCGHSPARCPWVGEWERKMDMNSASRSMRLIMILVAMTAGWTSSLAPQSVPAGETGDCGWCDTCPEPGWVYPVCPGCAQCHNDKSCAVQRCVPGGCTAISSCPAGSGAEEDREDFAAIEALGFTLQHGSTDTFDAAIREHLPRLRVNRVGGSVQLLSRCSDTVLGDIPLSEARLAMVESQIRGEVGS